ncbi:conjugal transfer protein TraD [Candidatus Sororendozoicomonas aggregata]
MPDEILKLNTPGTIIEVSREEAEELGAFEEDALSEEDALDAIEEEQEE